VHRNITVHSSRIDATDSCSESFGAAARKCPGLDRLKAGSVPVPGQLSALASEACCAAAATWR